MSQVINDYQLMKISSFIDGELEINEIKELLREMDKNPNLKDAYFKLFDLSLASKELTNTSIKKNIKNLSISSIIISFTNIGGYFYFLSSLVLNSIFIFYAYVLLINPYNPRNENFPKEKKLFLYSIFYLFMLFLLLLIEHFTKLLFPSYLIMVKDLIWI